MSLTAKERLILIRVKLERAKKHLAEFEAEASKFRATYSYVVGPKKNDKTGKRRIDILPVKVPVASFTLVAIAGDVIQNLRTSLDHLAYQLALVGSPGVEPGRKVGFPICASAEIYRSAKLRKLEGMRADAIKAIDNIRPYKGGNDALWKLHNFNNVDKHQALLTIGSDYLMEGVGFDGQFWVIAEDPLFGGIYAADLDKNSQLTLQKTLGSTQDLEVKPLLPTLHQLVDYVDNLITDFLPLLE
jgi:hypothetical protein